MNRYILITIKYLICTYNCINQPGILEVNYVTQRQPRRGRCAWAAVVQRRARRAAPPSPRPRRRGRAGRGSAAAADTTRGTTRTCRAGCAAASPSQERGRGSRAHSLECPLQLCPGGISTRKYRVVLQQPHAVSYALYNCIIAIAIKDSCFIALHAVTRAVRINKISNHLNRWPSPRVSNSLLRTFVLTKGANGGLNHLPTA